MVPFAADKLYFNLPSYCFTASIEFFFASRLHKMAA